MRKCKLAYRTSKSLPAGRLTICAQVSPYFKTYLQRGLAKVRQHIQNAAAARAAAAAAAASTSEGCEPMAVSPAPAAKVSNGGGTSGSTWGSPDGEATVAPMTREWGENRRALLGRT